MKVIETQGYRKLAQTVPQQPKPQQAPSAPQGDPQQAFGDAIQKFRETSQLVISRAIHSGKLYNVCEQMVKAGKSDEEIKAAVYKGLCQEAITFLSTAK